jgi:hypothetical protein
MSTVTADSSSSKSTKKTADPLAALSYVGATAVQYTLIITALHILQIKVLKALSGVAIPFLNWQVNEVIVTMVFATMSLRR